MKIALITGSCGLIGSEASLTYLNKGYSVIGIDNNMRATFFGEAGSTAMMQNALSEFTNYKHYSVDIRNKTCIDDIFLTYNTDIEIIIHAAAQPSHDWATNNPMVDFSVNAEGTLNMLEATRTHAPQASFIFMSTNKVYGDHPNNLPLEERETRWEIDSNHRFSIGIDETMSIDQCKHSLFGASKVAADIMVQEYGKYFGLKTCVFRGGCLTGPNHQSVQLHGFLSYLLKCSINKTKYIIHGYKGKQVRDNIHSADVVRACNLFQLKPRYGEVYNIGGGRGNSCSVMEAISLCENITGNKMEIEYSDANRNGDHIWWISNTEKFQKHYPQWYVSHNLNDILSGIYYNRSI